MNHIKPFRVIAVSLAALHVLPARHHLADMFARFNGADAWKGIGAAIAVAFLLLDCRVHSRVIATFKKNPPLLPLGAALLVIVHLVPAIDHVPKFFAHVNFADGWRALGASIAIMWFASPRAFQLAVVRLLNQRVRGSLARSSS